MTVVLDNKEARKNARIQDDLHFDMFVEKAISDIDFSPTDGMKVAARRALAWRSEYGRGGTGVGIARARDIVNSANLSPSTVRRMFSFFSRHEVDKQASGFNQGEEGFPSNGRIAWDLWGGDAGFAWAKQKVNQIKRELEKNFLLTETDPTEVNFGGVTYEDTGIEVIGVSFGSETAKDLQNTYITEKSAYTNTLPWVFLTLNHGGTLDQTVGFIGESLPIGLAKYVEKTDEGHLYRLYTEKAKRFKEFIKKLYEENLLSTSNTPLQRAAKYNLTEKGFFEAYPTVEVAIVPEPADPRTATWWDDIKKSLGGEQEMTDTQETVPNIEAPVAAETETAPPVAAEVPSAVPVISATQQLEKMAQGDTQNSNLVEMVNALTQRLEILEKSIAAVNAGVTDIQLALPALGEVIQKSLTYRPTNADEGKAVEKALTPTSNKSSGNFSGTMKFFERQ